MFNVKQFAASAVIGLATSGSAQAVTLSAIQAEDAISSFQGNSFFGTGFSAPGVNEVGSQRSDNFDAGNRRAARTFAEFTLTADFIAEAQAALGTGTRLELDFLVTQIVNGPGKLEGLDIRYFGIAAGDRTANTLWNTAAVESAHNVLYATSSTGSHTGTFSNSQVIADIAAATPGQVIAFGLTTDLGVDNSVTVNGPDSRQVYILDEAATSYTLAIGPALDLITPVGIVQTQGNALGGFAIENLINNSGFSTAPTVADYTTFTHQENLGGEARWVTATGVFPSNYFTAGQVAPQFVLDLGEQAMLTDLVVWGYAGNANEATDFLVEFSTDGGASFYASSFVQSSFLLGVNSATLTLGDVFAADAVRITMLNNAGGRGLGGVGPGDRVGLGEIKFLAQAVIPEPSTLALATLGFVGLLRRRVRHA